eukprot:10035915-Ditylum_brightwellii.AAC.1
MTKGTNLWFVPETGVMAAYDKSDDKRAISAFLTGAAKVQTTISSKVMIAGFIQSHVHCPLTEKDDSPFYISPFTLASEMPRSNKDDTPAFHQLGKVEKQSEIHGICIPSLRDNVPKYAKRVIHYAYAQLVAMGVESYADRVLSPEAILEAYQHMYDMATHKVVAKDIEVQMVAIQDGLEGFEDIEDPRTKDHLTNEEDEVSVEHSELGSHASRQALEKAKKLAATPRTPTKMDIDDSDTDSEATEVTKNRTPAKAQPTLSRKDTKERLKMVMVQLTRSNYHVDEVVANADNSISVPT